MPYVRNESASPPRQWSPSPEANDANPGPSKRQKMSAADHQRRQLDKLLENPGKEVALPQGIQEKTLRAPREMMKNVQGSSAGAGSGEFHVYKQSRRREFERIKIMTDQQRALDEQAAFKARQAERDALADAKTAKNRQKRHKRKGKKADEPTAEEVALVGRKLANPGGSGMVFKRPEDDGSEDEGAGEIERPVKENSPVKAAASGSQNLPLVEPPKVAVIAEPRIVVHDDD